MTTPGSSRFLELLAEKRRKDEAAKAIQPIVEQFASELIPEQPYQKSEADVALDKAVESIDILDAYARWCGKMRPHVRPGQRESIKLSCPNPAHPDVHPSAWVNLDKQAGTCNLCGGFDAHDIAAYSMGFDVPGYKKDGTFPKLRRRMAEAVGYTVERTLGGEFYVVPPTAPEPDKQDKPDLPDILPEPDKTDISGGSTTGSAPNKTVSGNVEDLYSDEEEYEIQLPTLDWRKIVPNDDTFLDRYMEACCKDEVPEEYHFFNGLLAIGFAAGREVTLASKLPVYGNLFLCALGKSGAGKSTAAKHLYRLVKRVLPYDPSDPNTRGVTRVTPSSAEVLIKSFSRPVPDPADPTGKRVAYYAPVRGLIDFNELAGLIGRANRQGNILKPIMMDFYDMNTEVRTQSLNSGNLIAEDPFASCLTTSQPRALRDLLQNTDDASGFLNRWVYIGGVPKKSTIMGTGPVDIGPPAEKLTEIRGWAGSFLAGEQIIWQPEALKLMQKFFDEQIYPLKNNQDTNIYVRMDLLMLKLALLFAVNQRQREVTVDIVTRVRLMFAYVKICYGIPAGQIGNTLEHEMTEAIVYQMRRLDKDSKGTTLNAIAIALKKRKYPKEKILRNIKALIELGFVEERVAAAGAVGRPTKRYVYVA